MNAAQLLAQFEMISEAPDAVARLRRFVLDLAVRGKLVPQDPCEEPASELLKRIAREKGRLLKAGEIRKADAFVENVALPDNIHPPIGWNAVTLQSLCRSITDGDHLPPPKSEGGVPFLVIGNVRHQRIDFTGSRFVPNKYYEALDHSRRPRSGDLLYTLVGSFGIPVLVRDDRPFCIQRHIGILRPVAEIDVFFLARLMESGLAFRQATACATGIAQKTVPLSGLRRFALPLPPLDEQRRIVAKVDELMALCDRLQTAQTAREATRDRLAASLARLNTPDPETFPADARFALDALPALTTRPGQIKQLRQTILNLAVTCRLSPTAAWSLRPEKLGTVASLQNGYAFKSEWFSREGIRLARNANVGHGKLDWGDEVRVPAARATEFERFRLSEGDVLVSLDRPFIVTGTKVARATSADLPALLLQRVGRFILTPRLDPAYVFLWVTSPHFAAQIDPGRSNGVPHISSKQVEAASIFVPPLAEQHRLVAKVNALMALCDALEASLATASATRTSLLEATLRDALRPLEGSLIEAAA